MLICFFTLRYTWITVSGKTYWWFPIQDANILFYSLTPILSPREQAFWGFWPIEAILSAKPEKQTPPALTEINYS
jgi:hypothetical protein